MDLGLANKRVLVTGGSHGIGFSIVESFLQEQAKVFYTGRNLTRLKTTEKQLKKTYGDHSVWAKQCDSLELAELQKLSNHIQDQHDGVDIVVANVGDGRSVPDPVSEPEHWQKVWNTNFESAVQTTRVFLPQLVASSGCLVFISSIAGLEILGAPVDYSTAKAALIAFAKNLAVKVSPEVRVNIIAPGNVLFKNGTWDEKLKNNKVRVEAMLKQKVPMQRFAKPEEIADAAVFICSRRASFITGTTLVVDGGQTVSV